METNTEKGQTPTLVLDGIGVATTREELNLQDLQKDGKQTDVTRFTEEERKAIDEFAKKIEIMDTNMVLQYGSGAQKKVADFSENALEGVRTKSLGEVGGLLTNLVGELKGFGEEEPKGILGFFKKGGDKIGKLKIKYAKAEVNVGKIVEALESHQIVLMKDVATLDKLYELNQGHFKEIAMYVAAGKKKLEEVKNNDLPAVQGKASQSGLAEDAQEARDLATMCARFEKKLHDLELTKTISLQMAPQIRLVQNNDTLMSDKIQSTLVNTIPLWKSQMVLALGLAHSEEAAVAQRTVTDTTNNLLRKNAEMLKISTIETAKESERGIVDLDTLKYTNESLISTLDEVLRIQEEGHKNRMAAEMEISKLEGDLKSKLLEVSR